MTNELESEKKKGEAFNLTRGCGSQFWWESSVEEMELFELEQLMICLFEEKRCDGDWVSVGCVSGWG